MVLGDINGVLPPKQRRYQYEIWFLNITDIDGSFALNKVEINISYASESKEISTVVDAS